MTRPPPMTASTATNPSCTFPHCLEDKCPVCCIPPPIASVEPSRAKKRRDAKQAAEDARVLRGDS